jgi:hypothetical protein
VRPCEWVVGKFASRCQRADYGRGEAGEYQKGDIASQRHGSPIGEPLISREEAAKKLNVGTSSVDRARQVLATRPLDLAAITIRSFPALPLPVAAFLMVPTGMPR